MITAAHDAFVRQRVDAIARCGCFEQSRFFDRLESAQAADLLAGRWYVNIHTVANKAGEIRGQLTK